MPSALGSYRETAYILPRVLADVDAVGEEVAVWPTPPAVATAHFGRIEAPGGGEQVAPPSQSFQRIRFRFRHVVSIEATDRIHVRAEDLIYDVLGVFRERAENGGWQTVCDCVLVGAPWTPEDVSGIEPCIMPAASRSAGGLWQDAAKTVAASAHNDPVRVATCPYTGTDYTAPSDAARPLLQTDAAGKWWLLFDGVDDYLTPGNVMSGATAGYIAARILHPSPDPSGTASGLWVWGGAGSDDPKSFFDNNADIFEAFGTSTRENILSPTLSLNSDRTWEIAADGSGWDAWLDGEIQATRDGNTVPTWSTTPRVGHNSAVPFAGRVYGLILVSAIPGAVDQELIRNLLAGLDP